ncbi:GWT1-domain-containing protein [Dipodascopsis uninucleata]
MSAPAASFEINNDRSVFKHLKEEFVSELTGGSIQEINIITLVALSAYAVWCAIQTRFSLFGRRDTGIPQFLSQSIEFIINWLTMLLSITIYASHPLALNLLLILPATIIYMCVPPISNTKQRAAKALLRRRDRKVRNQSFPDGNGSVSQNPLNSSICGTPVHIDSRDSRSSGRNHDSSQASTVYQTGVTDGPLSANISESHPIEGFLPRKSFLSNYRAGMMILTCIAILAVDFRIFPRRFAKVETWGTSLMDLGVGSFVFSMGLVSARSPLKAYHNKNSPHLLSSLKSSVRQTASVLLLGILRLLLVKAVDYHEHISEYGVHWNFFMTLGFLPPFVIIINYCFGHISSVLLSIIVGVIYQILLDLTPLTEFILSAPRTGIISMNKEGIFSFIGYLAIFLAGQATGFYTLPSTPVAIPFISKLESKVESNSVSTSKRSMITFLTANGLGHALMFQICTRMLKMRVSRRLANLPYVLWVSSYNNMYILMFLLVEMCFFSTVESYEDAVPWGIEAVNINGLAIFLFANILTGAVNLSVNTLEMNSVSSVVILAFYCAILASAAGAMKKLGLRARI